MGMGTLHVARDTEEYVASDDCRGEECDILDRLLLWLGQSDKVY